MRAEDARAYIGKRCAVTYLDRSGAEVTEDIQVYDLEHVQLYGTYLVGDSQDINIDRVTGISAQAR